MLKENKFLVLKEKGKTGNISTYLVEDNVTGERAYLKTFSGEDAVAFAYITDMNCLKDAGIKGVLAHIEAGIMEEECGYYMLFREIGGPTLEEFLEMGAPLTESETKRIAAELKSSLECLHRQGYLHLFLCAKNVFYSPGKPVIIKDPALTAEAYEKLMEEIECPDYSAMSPGLMDGEEATDKDDDYALAMLMIRLAEKAEWSSEEARDDFLRMSEGLKGAGSPRSCEPPASMLCDRERGSSAELLLPEGMSCGKREAAGADTDRESGAAGGPLELTREPGEALEFAGIDECLKGILLSEEPLSSESMEGCDIPKRHTPVDIWRSHDLCSDESDKSSIDNREAVGSAPDGHVTKEADRLEKSTAASCSEVGWSAAPLRISVGQKAVPPREGPQEAKAERRRPRRPAVMVGAAVFVMALMALAASSMSGKGSGGAAGVSVTAEDGRVEAEQGLPVRELEGAAAVNSVTLDELMASGGAHDEPTTPSINGGGGTEDGAVPRTATTDPSGRHEEGERAAAAANQAPRAAFTATPSQGPSPLQVILDASASSDPDGRIVSYVWSCGGSGQRIYRVFESPVIPTRVSVTLTVTDDRGASSSTSKVITLY